ncbi:MAG: hypothetical protein WA580_06445 [Acidimicrobiales bacterium]
MVATYDDASLVVNPWRGGTAMNLDEAYGTISLPTSWRISSENFEALVIQ